MKAALPVTPFPTRRVPDSSTHFSFFLSHMALKYGSVSPSKISSWLDKLASSTSFSSQSLTPPGSPSNFLSRTTWMKEIAREGQSLLGWKVISIRTFPPSLLGTLKSHEKNPDSTSIFPVRRETVFVKSASLYQNRASSSSRQATAALLPSSPLESVAFVGLLRT